ncbi:AMP-binding protein [Nocardia testacea]|uniref:AMP-binding protein n=1 Tax=Nocardia testacea TaxID=248551 RepID=UPI003C2C9820
MTTLPQLIANAVETNPDGAALVLADGTGPLEQVSYADLDAWSSRLARSLMARGIGPEDLVAVAIPRSLDAVLAVWAVAKTGAGFVPIDPAYPPNWIAHLLVDVGAVYGLAVSWVRNELPDEIEWLRVDTVDAARSLEQFSSEPVTYADRIRPLRAEHPAYVSYVSDGEASPDGVVVTQAGLSGLCAEQQGRFRVEPEDRTLNFAPLPSDSAVLELLLALGGAATMVVVSPLVSTADELTELLRRTGVTHAYLTPEALEVMDPAGLDELGVVIAGRRPCPPESVSRWAIPVAGGATRVLYQGYGPAEATIVTNISTALTPGRAPTLGAPIRGVTAHILDGQLAQVPTGAVGELYLGGPQLARGYHRRPGRTAQLLVADPYADDGARLFRTGDLVRRADDGELEYVGRVELPPLPDATGPRVLDTPQATVEAAADPEVPLDRSPADFEQSLPIREAAALPGEPDLPAAEAEQPVEANTFAGYGYGLSHRESAAEPEPMPPARGLPGEDSRLASERRDMELPGRGYLEMPDRSHPLGARGARPAESSPTAAEATEPAEPDADSRLGGGRQLPAPGDTQTPRGGSYRAAGDALAFYENTPEGAATPGPSPAVLPATRPEPGVAEFPFGARDSNAPSPLWPDSAGASRGAEPSPEPLPAPDDRTAQRPESIPLSPGQLRLWERNRFTPEEGVDTVTAAMTLTGTLDAAAMQAAVADVVDRHETLRTVYPEVGGTPHQVVLPRERAVPEVVAEPVAPAELADWLQALARTDFDVADPEQVPVRFALAETGPREHVVAVVVHRILADEVSAGLLLRDLLRAFLGRRNRSRPLWQPLSVQYLDYFLSRQAELGDSTDPDSLAAARLAFWREYLAGLPPRLEIPAAAVRSGATGYGVHGFEIGTRTHRRIADIARRGEVSEFIVVRAAFAVLLARSAAVTDIVLGSSVRGHDERELDDAIGPYANTVVLRTRIDPAESFLDLVVRLAESDRAAFAHADLPFEILDAAIGAGAPLFDIAISLRHNDVPRLEMPSLSTEPIEIANTSAECGLRLVIDPHRAPDGSPDGIAAALHYAADRFDTATVTEFARRLQRVLTVAGGDPDSPVGDIDLLSRADLDRLLVVWNDTRYPVAPDLLLDGYRRTVATRPDTVAVADAESELTYQEFDARVNRLARRLIEAGVGTETPVGVALRNSTELLVAIYAVLTAGGACLPLDPDDPAGWNARILDLAGPACVLVAPADEARLAAAVESTTRPRPSLLVTGAEDARHSADPVRPEELIRQIRPGHAAYLLCASVSPDGPELAVLSHSAINNQITLMLAQYPMGFTDVYLQQNPPTRDTSLWGTFLPLRAGAELALAPAGARDPEGIAATIAARAVTVTDFGPGELAAFAEHADPGPMRSLREVFVTGGPLAPEIAAAVRERCGARAQNLYGTAETAVSATSWPAAGSADRSVPIGLPQWNTRVYVLDSRLRPVPPGVPGELYLAGDQLARGYLGRHGATADRFVANPFGYGQRMYRTGDLVRWRDATATTPQRLDYLGRTDDQLGHRGHRIRPAAVAAALRALPGIAEAAVLTRGAGPAVSSAARPGARLVAYVVAEQAGAETDLARVRAALAQTVPGDLVPSAFAVVEQIPLTATGAPDRTRLPDPDEIAPLPPDPGPWAAEAVAGTTGAPDAAETAPAQPEPRVAEPAAAPVPLPGTAPETSGELPATPTVARLLDNPVPGVEVRSVVLDLPADQPLSRTEIAVRSLMARHPMLSARLDAGERPPALWIPPREQRGERQYWWLGPESGENTVATDDVVQAAADALDPATGRNIHFVVTGTGPDRRLVVVANGLAVDDRSWRIIIDELLAGWSGAELAPAAPESKLPQLVHALDARARSIELLDESGWWRRNLAGAQIAAPLGTADLRARRRVSLAITAEGTAAVTAAAAAYGATVPEVLLTAVAVALHTGAQGKVARAIGSLVRCDADARSFVNGTGDLVGGFATEFPLSVRIVDIDTTEALVGGSAAGSALVQIRDLYRSVPDGGAGYALLRHLNPETTAEFAAAESGRLTLRYRDLRPARVHTDGPADGVPLALTVDATDDGLLCRFDYATDVFAGEDVKTFAEHWVRALGGLAEHGLRPDVGVAGPAPAPQPAPVAEPAPAQAPEPAPDAEVTSLLRPVTGIPDAAPEPDHGAPPRPHAQPGAAAHPLPDTAGAPERSGLPRRRIPDAETPAPGTDAGAAGTGLPQRGAATGTAASAQPESGPETAFPTRDTTSPAATGIDADEMDSAATASPSALPQRRRRPEADSGVVADPGPASLPQRRPGLDVESAGVADSGSASLSQRRRGLDAGADSGPVSLPQPRRRPDADAESAAERSPVSLPQRRPGPDAEAAAEPSSGPGSLPQRRPRPDAEAASVSEPGPVSLSQHRPGPSHSAPDAASPEPAARSGALPQRRPRHDSGPAGEPVSEQSAESSVAPQAGPRYGGDAAGESAATVDPTPSALPGRRSAALGQPEHPGTETDSPEAAAATPGLPRRGPRHDNGSLAEPAGVSEPAPVPLPQRRSRLGAQPDVDSAAALSEAVSAESGRGPEPLPERRSTAAAGSAPTGTGSESASAPALPQRGARSAVEADGPAADTAADPAPAALPRREPRDEAESAPVELPPALPRRRPQPLRDETASSEPRDWTLKRSKPAAPEPVPAAAPGPELTADPEPTTFLRPIPDVETTAYMSPVTDLAARDDQSTLLSLFDEQVSRTPTVPAVRQGARVLSYSELDRKSRALAAELIRFGVGDGTLVAVAMRPGIDLVVAVCAVLRAGGGYVPVDPGRPAGEVDEVLAAAAPICVLSTSDEGLTTGTGISVVAIDLLYLDLPTDPSADPPVAADDLADIRYVPGGSAGVTSTHRQLVERLRRAQRSHPYDSSDLVLHAAPTVTDITLWELFRPLHHGAQILMPDHPGRAADLSRSIAANRVTIVHVVPSLLDRFLDSVTDGGGRAAHPSLRRVVVDGAALPPGGVERFTTVLPGAELVIWYGHNETGVITVGSVGGRPVTNDRVYLLDEQLRPVPPGTVGEMYIGGPQLARGYHAAAAETASRFVATGGGGRLYRTGDLVRRRDGVLEYLGRVERVGGSLMSGSRRGGHD